MKEKISKRKEGIEKINNFLIKIKQHLKENI